MNPVLTKIQAYKLDKDSMKSKNITHGELIDNAGKSVAQFFLEKIKEPFNQKVLVFCGKGNNGGDGIIAHYYLKKYNVSSKIVFTEKKHNHSWLIKKYKISKDEYLIYNDKIIFNKYNWIIDGIFGIGLSREIDTKYKKIINFINNYKHVISIDIPSGMFADSNKSNCFINSTHVVTFGYSKLAHFLNPLKNIFIYNIGFTKINKIKINQLDEKDISSILKSLNKKNDIHKYSKGKCCIYAGSDLYPGAGILSAKAALVSGSGYINLFIKSDNKHLINSIDTELPEIIVNNINNSSYFNYKFPLLVGPGDVGLNELIKFGFNPNETKDIPVVIDAKAAIDWRDTTLPLRSIITPHLGELKKMFKLKDNYTDYTLLKNIQKKIGRRIVILKSFNTFIITKDMIYIMDTGTSILATAGTGDVLAGILVSLLSQGYSRLEASILGTYLHAEAGNYYMNNISKDGMTASDLINCIPNAFNKLRAND